MHSDLFPASTHSTQLFGIVHPYYLGRAAKQSSRVRWILSIGVNNWWQTDPAAFATAPSFCILFFVCGSDFGLRLVIRSDSELDPHGAALQQALGGETFVDKERRLSEMILQLQMVRDQLLVQQDHQNKVGHFFGHWFFFIEIYIFRYRFYVGQKLDLKNWNFVRGFKMAMKRLRLFGFYIKSGYKRNAIILGGMKLVSLFISHHRRHASIYMSIFRTINQPTTYCALWEELFIMHVNCANNHLCHMHTSNNSSHLTSLEISPRTNRFRNSSENEKCLRSACNLVATMCI